MATQSTLTQFISAALPSAIRSVEIRTAFAPPQIINVQEALNPPPASSTKRRTFSEKLAALVQPTVIMSGGSLGQQVIAPYGAVDPNAWKRNLVLLAGGAFGAGVLLGVVFFAAGRRSR